MIWLGIETSNVPLSIAVMNGDEVLAEEVMTTKVNHSVRAMSAVERVMAAAEVKPSDLDAIAVTEGPGSYTGVRIGVTIAKTLAWTLHVPLVGISSMRVMAANCWHHEGVVAVGFDARRDAVYSAAYFVENGVLNEVIEEQHRSFDEWLDALDALDVPILFVGPDRARYEERLRERLGDRFQWARGPFNTPRASLLIECAKERSISEDVHTFVPEYARMTEAEANLKKEENASCAKR